MIAGGAAATGLVPVAAWLRWAGRPVRDVAAGASDGVKTQHR